MPTELEELVGFIAHPRPDVRHLAAENLVPYSSAQPSIFKADNAVPIKNLKLLIKDVPQTAQHVLTILVNLSADNSVLESLVTDEKFLSELLRQVTVPSEPNADLQCMLLANLAKSDALKSILQKKQPAPEGLGSDDVIMNQLLDLFVKGAEGSFNKKADFDHLAYLFADLTKHAELRQYFLSPQKYDGIIPLNKIKVFTEHKSNTRRKGVASIIKNVAFEIPTHPSFLSEDDINILPYILLPITGNEEYDVDETMAMLPDLQLLPPDKQRDSDPNIIETHIETLLLLTTTRKARDYMREIKVYPIIRETHSRVAHDGVKDACDRLVQVLMRDEEDEAKSGGVKEIVQGEEEDEDNQIMEV